MPLVLALVAVAVLVRQPFPETEGELTLAGPRLRRHGVPRRRRIPQLYGDSTSDLMKAQGFVHAQERFFEMDVRRHITSGRLSEMFGEATVETDTFVRTLGWREVAEKEVALLDPETRVAFEAYADGVNAYLEQTDPGELALEYSVLGLDGLDYEPEPWTTADSLAWLKAMAWDLRGNMVEEIDRVLSLSMNSPEMVAELFPAYDPGSGDPSSPRAPLSTASSTRPRPVAAGCRNGPATSPPRPRSTRCRRSVTGSTGYRRSSARATASAPTAGWSPATGPRPASRCSPTILTSASACPGSGCRWGCTAGPSARTARSTSRASRSRGHADRVRSDSDPRVEVLAASLHQAVGVEHDGGARAERDLVAGAGL